MSDEWNNSNSVTKVVKISSITLFLKQNIFVIKSKYFNS